MALVSLGACAPTSQKPPSELATSSQPAVSQPSPTRVPKPARYFDIESYVNAVRGKIRSMLGLPADVPDTATVTFLIEVDDTGAVRSMKQVSTSGSSSYEDAVRLAILRSSPLPLLGPEGTKQRPLELVFRVKD